jgi:iron(III) transport system ATP-binding protein
MSEKDNKSAQQPSQNWGERGTAGVSFAAALSFHQVDVYMGVRHVLKKIDLAIKPGEIVCLLGESGSGKSTILHAAAGILGVQGGEVRVNDTIVSSARIAVPPEKRGIGLMFQDFALFPHLNVLQNVAFGLDRLGRNEARAQARAALARVGLGDREKEFPHMLSGGQQQRLALARAFAPRPGILMLDEPFSSLDARLRENVRAETLAILRETRATTIIVTHDPEEAMVLGDRIALLRGGRVVQIDATSAIYHTPVDLGVARFFSPLTEISSMVKSGGVETPLGMISTPGRKDGEKVIVAIRPVGALNISSRGSGVPGRIVSKREALGLDIYEVLVQGIKAPVRIRYSSNHALQPGSDILLTLNPEHVLVFGQD